MKKVRIKTSKSQRSGKITSRVEIAKSNKKNLFSRSTKGRSFFSRPNFKDIKWKNVRKKAKKVGLVMLGIFFIVLMGGSIFAYSYLNSIQENLPSPDEPFKNPPISTIIYDRKSIENVDNGTLLYKVIGDFNSDPVNIDEIPEHVKWAFLAAEDRTFYTHEGFDLTGILSCGLNYLRSSGGSLCGGSTITQQLVKITALTNEVKLERKIKELLLATQVEQQYDKDTILQMYLSVSPYGGNIVGITTASRYYFDKEPKDLTLAEAAVLASIVQNPSYLSPTNPVDGDRERAQIDVKDRQLYVLDQILENKEQINNQIRQNKENNDLEDVFTEESVNQAKDEELNYVQNPVATNKLAGHFVDYVVDKLLTENYKNGEEPFTVTDLQNGGYKVITSLDYEVQKVAEEQVAKGGNDYKYAGSNNAAILTIRPQNGEIIAMAGSKNFYGESEGCDVNGQNCLFNGEVNVLTSLQSPGSTNKPLGYYKAYEQGIIYPGSPLPDVPVTIGSYVPKNWNSKFEGIEVNGSYSAKEMLRKSRNIPALIVIEAIGINTYLDEAEKFGYTTYGNRENFGHSVVLGGTDVYPIEHATAYGVFANGGDYVKANPILKILDRDGNVVYQASPERERVGNPQASFLINQTLLNLNDGINAISWGDGRDVAGKTGTTENNKDSWLVMYSPDFVTIGWAGNNNNNPMNSTYGYPAYTVTPWLKQYMSRVGGFEYFAAKTPFKNPGFVYRGGGCDEGKCLGVQSDWLIQDKQVPSYITVQNINVCKDQQDRVARPIDIETGFAMEKKIEIYKMPAPSWQKFLDAYLKSKDRPTEVPSKECDIDRTGGVQGPFFIGTSASINGSDLNVKGSVYSTEGELSELSVSIAGNNIPGCTTTDYSSFDITCSIKDLGVPNGPVTVIISAKDTQNFTNSKNLSVNVDIGLSFSALPPDVISLGQSYPITVANTGVWNLNNVDVWMVRNSGNPSKVGSNIHNSNYSFDWSVPNNATAGDKFYFYITAKNNGADMISANSKTVTAQ